jgi:glucokinase
MIGAVDIGGTKIAAGAVTRNGRIITRLETATAPERGFASAMAGLKAMLREVERRAGARLTGIGVASTGPVDPFTGVFGDVGTLPGWQGGNLMTELGGEFCVPVAVENDADGAALAEARWGAARDRSRSIYITVSTGIGGGIVISGELYRGVEGSHPEPGHQVIDPSGPLCYCTARGCWESLASGPAMANWMRQKGSVSAGITAEEVCRLARQGDPLALKAVERAAYYLGLGLANLVTLFAPDVITLGGGLMKSADLLLDPARQVIRRICTQVPAGKVAVVPAALGADGGLAGAACAFLARYR